MNRDEFTFDKFDNKIVIVHFGDVLIFPPVLNLIKNLLFHKYNILLISSNTNNLPVSIKNNNFFNAEEIELNGSVSLVSRIKRRFVVGRTYRQKLVKSIGNDDILWTTTDLTVRILGDIVLNYHHIMQLMELAEWYPMFEGASKLHFPVYKYARKAWKVVVPEINRAYIQKIWWDLDNIPYVLPNKPYELERVTENSIANVPRLSEALKKIKKEKRKIIMYLGNVSLDRDLNSFAEAVSLLGEEYCLYVIGAVRQQVISDFNLFRKRYPFVEFLGYFPAPNHLLFLEYAYIGLLPYTINPKQVYPSPLNVLYCAPNKIFEYAAYGVPMIGSDLLGLRIPFSRFNCGYCCDEKDPVEISNYIKKIDDNYNSMSKRCYDLYNSVDLDEIVNKIIND